MKRKVKKKKLKIGRVIIVFLIFLIIIFLMIIISKLPVMGFYISGNTYYTDSEILSITTLDEYPSFLFTNSININSKIKNNEIIDSIKIKKTLDLKFKVLVKEKKILFYDLNEKKSITATGEKIKFYDENSPVMINTISNKKIYNNFISKMNKIDTDILKNISEIKYDPNEIDDERFFISMNDGNYVYVTLSKFSNINNYTKISRTLGEKNGILYLDYGNYFVPKE